MKKITSIAISVLVLLSLFALPGCKEDTTPPKITVIGSTDTIIAKGSVYLDPGATAEDDKDESVYVVTDYSTTNPDESVTGEYTINYKAQDRNANMAAATRKVNVTWTGSSLAFTYNVVDTCLNDLLLNTTYQSSMTQDLLNVFRIKIGYLMGSFTGDTYADIKGNAITIPSQKPDGASSAFTVSGAGTITDSPPNIIMDIHYTVTDATPGPTLYRHAIFIY